jgi:predicted dehydrogenase
MKATRREFVKHGAAGAFTLAAMGLARNVTASVNQKEVNVGIIGCGGRWRSVSDIWAKQDGLRIRYLCDVDNNSLSEAASKINIDKSGLVGDMRRIFDDKSIDAVYIATPDHWHTPAAILALESGKHVYVEKPTGHNVREGRLLVDATKRNNKVVQHGTQVRSTPTIIQGVKLLHDGIIGDVLMAKVWNVQMRNNIGHQRPSNPPSQLNYDMWVGPASMMPYQGNCHGQWHYWYNFGTGDMGNDGVHDIDYGRWGLGVAGHPAKVSAYGGKYFFDDDQEFPDTQQVTFEYAARPGSKPRLLVYEQRLWSTNYPSTYNCDSGVEYYGTKGQMFLSRRGKIQVLGPNNKHIEINVPKMPQDTEMHVANFLKCECRNWPLKFSTLPSRKYFYSARP